MNPSAPFIQRPVATSLLMIAILLVGLVGYDYLPLSALPEVDYPTIQVQTFLPGASPEVMTSSVTAPLEKQFGQMPGLNQMSSMSSAGASVITLQFALSLSLDVAEQEVQAAINACGQSAAIQPSRAADLCQGQSGRCAGPDVGDQFQVDAAHRGRGPRRHPHRAENLAALPASALSASPAASGRPYACAPIFRRLRLMASTSTICARRSPTPIPTRPKAVSTAPRSPTPSTPTTSSRAPRTTSNIVVAYKNGAPVHLSDVATVVQSAENMKLSSWMNKTPSILLNVQRQPGANVIAVVDPSRRCCRRSRRGCPAPSM